MTRGRVRYLELAKFPVIYRERLQKEALFSELTRTAVATKRLET